MLLNLSRVLTRERSQDGRKAISARHKERAALSNAIPDDWDEETSSSGEEDNQQIIWDNACDIFLSFSFTTRAET
jgi:hypothetical protein